MQFMCSYVSIRAAILSNHFTFVVHRLNTHNSYSNRWLNAFEGTHKLALSELAASGSSSTNAMFSGVAGKGSIRGVSQADLMKQLTSELYN
jgi:hypothetical protein